MYEGPERRRTPRKNVHLLVQIIVAGETVANGHIVDINCNGVKMEILFEMTDGETTLNELLALDEIGLAIGEPGDETFHIIVSAGVKWHMYSYSEDEKICMAGVELIMSELDQLSWQQYYNGL